MGKPPPSCSDVNIRASPPRKLAANVIMLSSPVLFACARTPRGRRCAADRGDAGGRGKPHPEVLNDLRQARGDCHEYVEVEHRFYDCRGRHACGAASPASGPPALHHTLGGEAAQLARAQLTCKHRGAATEEQRRDEQRAPQGRARERIDLGQQHGVLEH